MFYLVKRNSLGDLLFYNARKKGFRYDGGSSYASLESAKTAFNILAENNQINADEVEIFSHESILNHYNMVTSLD